MESSATPTEPTKPGHSAADTAAGGALITSRREAAAQRGENDHATPATPDAATRRETQPVNSELFSSPADGKTAPTHTVARVSPVTGWQVSPEKQPEGPALHSASPDDAEWPLHATDRVAASVGSDPVGAGDRFQPAVAANRADMARHAAVQISSAVAGGGDRVEIALNPEELGRVRMSIVTREDSIILHLGADRPETLDLMRRHIDELSSAFREIGYGSVAFTFGDGSDGTGEGAGGHEPDEAEIRTIATPDAPPERPTRPVSGLDMRI